MPEVILDVRERDEFESEHIEHSINVPLSQFALVAPGVLNQLHEKYVVIMCRSGNRARLAASQIGQLGYAGKLKVSVYEGGILKWKDEGKPVAGKKKKHFPIIRQVQLVAGSTVLATTLLGVAVSPWFLAITAFFGAGLTVAGATGFCGMANVLARMPWNQGDAPAAGELCGDSGSCCG